MVRLGRVEVQLDSRQLIADGQPLAISGKAFAILELLIAAEGKVVERDEIFRVVWPGSVVEQNNLQVHISAIRKALGDDRDLVQTVPGRGYRLLKPDEQTSAKEASFTELQRSAQLSKATPVKLVGRDRQIRDVLNALARAPIATLTGPGGIGKTQLALEVANQAATLGAAAPCFVSLSSLADGRFVQDVLASSLGLRQAAGAAGKSRLADLGDGDKLLLILDNCEHVIDDAAQACEELIRACRSAKVIATSREPLNIVGEIALAVPPLGVPEPSQPGGALRENAAIQLFLSHMVDAPSTDAELEHVATICRRLDGIPLAIVIAAAQAQAHGVEWLARELDDTFLLKSRLPAADSRHSTLLATYDWSYDLLGSTEKAVLRRLGAFTGDFPAELGAAVAAHGPLSAAEARAAIDELVRKSLVTLHYGGGSARASLLQTTRAYARQKLAEAGEAEATFARHAAAWLRLFDAEWQRGGAQPSAAWLDSLRRELDNLRVALDWSVADSHRLATGVELAALVLPHFYDLSLPSEGRARSKQMLSLMNHHAFYHPLARMRLAAAQASSRAYTLGPSAETREMWQQTLTLAKQLGEQDYEARATSGLWNTCQLRGEGTRSLQLAQQFVTLAAEQNSDAKRLIAKRVHGVALHFNGDQAGARKELTEMLAAYDFDSHKWKTIGIRIDHGIIGRATLARVMWLQGEIDDARRVAWQALSKARETGHEPTICHLLVEAILPLDASANEPGEAAAHLASLYELTSRFDFGVWESCGRCYDAYFACAKKASADNIARLRSVIDACDALEVGRYTAFFKGQLAVFLARAQSNEEALGVVSDTLDACNAHGDLWYAAELMRIKSEVLAGLSRHSEADRCFAQALAIARSQHADYFQMKVAVSHAMELKKRGYVGAALQLLDGVEAQLRDRCTRVEFDEAKAALRKLPPPTGG